MIEQFLQVVIEHGPGALTGVGGTGGFVGSYIILKKTFPDFFTKKTNNRLVVGAGSSRQCIENGKSIVRLETVAAEHSKEIDEGKQVFVKVFEKIDKMSQQVAVIYDRTSRLDGEGG